MISGRGAAAGEIDAAGVGDGDAAIGGDGDAAEHAAADKCITTTVDRPGLTPGKKLIHTSELPLDPSQEHPTVEEESADQSVSTAFARDPIARIGMEVGAMGYPI